MLYLAKKDKNEKMKNCYNLCENVNWDLTKFKNETDLYIDELRKYAREYIEDVLKQPLTKEQIWFLMPPDTRLIFNNYDSLLKEMLKNSVINKSNLRDLDWMNENLRISIWKYCYDTSEKLKWITDSIKDYCSDNNIVFSTFRYLTNQYINDVLQLDKDEKDVHRTKKEEYWRDYRFDKMKDNPKGKFATFFMKLLKTDNKEEIFKLVRDINKDHYYLRSEASDFVVVYYKSDLKVKEEILNKLKIYFDYVNEHRKNERDANRLKKKENTLREKLEFAEKMVRDYIDGQFNSVQEYCDKKEFNRNYFDMYIRLIKEHKKELYDLYIQSRENQKEKNNNDLASKAVCVVDLIKNGVIENGIKREFDLVDFYKYLPGDFVKTLRAVRDGLSNEDYMVLIEFTAKHRMDKELSDHDIDNLYNAKTVAGVQFDDKGKIIPGTGREITKEDKQNIINYLRNETIPVTNRTYNIIYKRWLSGSLILEQEKDKTK